MPSKRYLLKRTLQTVVLLWFVITFLFFFFRAMPGSFSDILARSGTNPEAIQAFEEKWGLDAPLHAQYLRYLGNVVQLDAGTSLQYREPVVEFVKMRLFNSFILIAPAITFAYVLGSIIGLVLGFRRGTKLEKYGIIPVISLSTVPEFFSSILLVVVFAGWLNLLPPSGIFSTELLASQMQWWEPYLSVDFLLHYILPFTAVVIRFIYLPVLTMRTSVVEVLDQGFIYFHRISGLPSRKLLRHIGKHAMLPVLTLYPVSMTRAISGIVLIEVVFNWPGIGFTLVQAVLSRDLPVVQFVFFLAAAFVIISNFVVDVLYSYIDPRVSVE